MSEIARPADARHPSWAEIRSYVESTTPSLHVIDGEPRFLLQLPGSNKSIEFLVPFTAQPPALEPLAEVETDVVRVEGEEWLRLRTSNAAAFPLFYEFTLFTADRAQEGGLDTAGALREAVATWRRLFQGASMLSPERQTGLYGELLLLRRLECARGGEALDCWTGPTAEAHDFRIGDLEIEVKTTRGERRTHTINGESQLQPSPNARLFVASVQLAAAGGTGESLAGLIADLRGRFEKHGRADRFSELIKSGCAVPAQTESYYSEQLKLRTQIALVPVDDQLPRITSQDLAQIGRPEMYRVSDLRFRLDLEGLGFADGTPEFLEVLPSTEEK